MRVDQELRIACIDDLQAEVVEGIIAGCEELGVDGRANPSNHVFASSVGLDIAFGIKPSGCMSPAVLDHRNHVDRPGESLEIDDIMR